MSSELSDDDTLNDPLKGPRVNTNQVMSVDTRMNDFSRGGDWASTSFGDTSWRRMLGSQYDGNRQLYDALGYKRKLRNQDYIAKYARGPGIAQGIVEKPIQDCWGGGEIEIVEAEDHSDERTPFEQDIWEFMMGQYTRVKPSARLRAADRWCRILEYSVILIGVQDGNLEPDDPKSMANEVAENTVNSLDDIAYLSVFDPRDVDWSEKDKVDDPTNPRYDLPEVYHVDFGGDVGTIPVHHSRLIHIVEEPGRNELKSPSVYKDIFNRLEDLEKLLGGSAEMFWRAAWPGLVLTPPTDADGVPMKFDDDGSHVANQIENYKNNLERLHRVTGNLEKLDTTVASPDDQIQVQVQDISAAKDIPMSIIRGNETGERATEEDKKMYHEFITNRRHEHCEEQILRPIVQRFIDWGAVSEPESGIETNLFDVLWPSLEHLTSMDKAEIALTWGQAFKEATGGDPTTIFTGPEIRKWGFEMDPERGAEAPDIDFEEMAAEDLTIDESALEEDEIPDDMEIPADD